MFKNFHRSQIAALSFSVVAMIATPLSPVAGQPLVTRELRLVSPQFVAHAVSFKALDETGWDRLGSDEVHVAFADFNPVQERATSVYDDVDAGETKRFRAADRCIAPLQTCDRGRSALHFGVALWEQDEAPWPFANFCPGTFANTHMQYDNGVCAGSDDLIGRVEINLDQAKLVAALPTVGATANYTVKPTGGAGSYEFTYKITRLDDVHRTIIIHLPPTLPGTITLQAVVSPGAETNVRLAWSGATTSTVDIFRNGVRILTTANDGAHIDPVAPGTYQYRLCNLGSTTACSAQVTIVVP